MGCLIVLLRQAEGGLGGAGLPGVVDNRWFDRIGSAYLLSFIKDASSAPDFAAAEAATSAGLDPKETYRFHIYRAGNEQPARDVQTPAGTVKFAVQVEVLEEAVLFVSGNKVLIQRNGGPWLLDTSMPT